MGKMGSRKKGGGGSTRKENNTFSFAPHLSTRLKKGSFRNTGGKGGGFPAEENWGFTRRDGEEGERTKAVLTN